jgi:glycosyltransferase involved in cell wall biosynthesis
MTSLTLGVLTYNDGLNLQSLFDSIVNQSVDDFKVLIVNNGKGGIEAQIIENFLNDNPEIEAIGISNLENCGSYNGLRKLISHTTTSHLGVIHGDDLLNSNYVEMANKSIVNYSDVCAFNFDLIEFQESDFRITGKIITSGWTSFNSLNRVLVAGLNPGVMPGSILNLKMLGKNYLNQNLNENMLNGAEDIVLWQSIIRDSYRIIRIPVRTYYYRRHTGQISKNYDLFGLSLGYARRLNFENSRTKIEKILCLSEMNHEFKSIEANPSYLLGIGHLDSYKNFHFLRFVNIFIRRYCKLVNSIFRVKL